MKRLLATCLIFVGLIFAIQGVAPAALAQYPTCNITTSPSPAVVTHDLTLIITKQTPFNTAETYDAKVTVPADDPWDPRQFQIGDLFTGKKPTPDGKLTHFIKGTMLRGEMALGRHTVTVKRAGSVICQGAYTISALPRNCMRTIPEVPNLEDNKVTIEIRGLNLDGFDYTPRIEIDSPAAGRFISQNGGFSRTAEGTLRVDINKKFPSAGTYRVRFSGVVPRTFTSLPGEVQLCEDTFRVADSREAAGEAGRRAGEFGELADITPPTGPRFCNIHTGKEVHDPPADDQNIGILTALGCIPTRSTQSFIKWFLGWAIGIAGGIAFLLILFAAFQIMTARGNPEQLQGGRELLTAAISGLILIIFSVFLLQLIGVQILNIPGFGTP